MANITDGAEAQQYLTRFSDTDHSEFCLGEHSASVTKYKSVFIVYVFCSLFIVMITNYCVRYEIFHSMPCTINKYD